MVEDAPKTDPELPLEPPLWMGNRSNGEYFHFQTAYESKLRRFVLEKADENARRVGLDRREFLASAMGMATTLWCINFASGCSSGGSGAGNAGSSAGGGAGSGAGTGGGAGSGGIAGSGTGGGGGSGGGGAGAGGSGGTSGDGGLCVPPDAMFDENAACAVIGGNEFIFDVQTHWFSQEDTTRFPPRCS